MADFVVDSLDASNGVNITARSGATGATWAYHPSYSGNLIFQSNGVYPSGSSVLAYASGIPSTAEYDVEADFYNVDGTISLGIGGRWSTSANTGYYVYHLSNQWHLIKAEGGTLTNLDSSTSYPLTNGVTYTVRLKLQNSLKQVLVNGVVVASSTDNTITAAGRAAIRSGAAGTSSTGKRILNFKAIDSSLFLSDSGTVVPAEMYKGPYPDAVTINHSAAITRAAFMAIGDSDTISVTESSSAVIALTRNDPDTIGEAARTFSSYALAGRTDLVSLGVTENYSVVTTYPVLRNDENYDDILERSGKIHYTVSRLVRQPYFIAYEHSGIYEESLIDPTPFVAVNMLGIPLLSGVANTDWITGETTVVIDTTIDADLSYRLGLLAPTRG